MHRIILFFIFFSTVCFSQNKNTNDLNENIKYSDTNTNKIGYLSIPMDHPIDQSTYIYVKLALEEFVKENVIFVVLDLNTPGGQVFAAQKISTALRNIDFQNNIPVIAFLNNWAVSAGSMLSYACRYIAVTPFSIMGAAEPVIAGGGEVKQASEKVNSAIRAEFMNLAATYNRNQNIAEAMVDKDVILVYRNNRIIKLQDKNQIRTSDVIISNKDKLLTLNSNGLLKYNVADIFIPYQKAEVSSDNPIEISQLFTHDFFQKIPNVEIIKYSNWKVKFFSFLSHPIVSSLLLMGMFIGFYIEINTPGFGLFGSIALVCLVLVLLNSLSIYAVSWLEVIILLAGLTLLAVELFAIPGFGFIGILGITLAIVGLFSLMVPNIQDITFNTEKASLTAISALNKLAWLVATILLSALFIFILGKYLFPRFSFFSRIVSKDEQEGYVSGPTKEMLPSIGEEGAAYTSLRPSGKITINEKLYDASSERNFIEKGEKIIVINIIGNRIIIKKK